MAFSLQLANTLAVWLRLLHSVLLVTFSPVLVAICRAIPSPTQYLLAVLAIPTVLAIQAIPSFSLC